MATIPRLRHLSAHLLLIIAFIATGALAQVTPAGGDAEPETVDQAVADTSPLATSLRVIDRGLDEPGDFGRVYRVPSSELFMRVQGGLYAVFPRSEYRSTKKGRRLAEIPADTHFYIGPPSLEVPESPAEPDARVGGPLDLRVAVAPIGPGETRFPGRVDISEPAATSKGTRPGLHRLPRLDAPVSPKLGPAVLRVPRSWSPPMVVPETTERPHDPPPIPERHALPTIAADSGYRSKRMRELIRRAAGLDASDASGQAARGPSSSSK